VTIAKCDRSGNPKGEAIEAVATILDKSANGATYDAIGKRYGLMGKTFNFFSKFRGGMQKNVTIELRPAN
jgi:PPOX class probable F420-dependent enzyme